ncbi:MAG: hypothetical protein HKM95_07680 [Inquilinus sp.]|nr:hypothetical protein [Inquilinus sp.]
MPFRFEHTCEFTEERYVSLGSEDFEPRRWRGVLVLVGVGVACLFWSYSFLLGLLILALAALARWPHLMLPHSSRETYRWSPYLGEHATYGLNAKEIWLSAPSIEIRVPWPMIYVWEEKRGWLRLHAYNAPQFWFPVGGSRKPAFTMS